MPGARSLTALAGAALAALAGMLTGCDDPFKHIEAASVIGRVSADVLSHEKVLAVIGPFDEAELQELVAGGAA